MGSILVQGLLIWLILSIAVMTVMTTLVMVQRARGQRESVAIVDPSPHLDEGDGNLNINTTDRDDLERSGEFVMPTRDQVTDQSSVLERLLAGATLPCELQPAPSASADKWMFVTHAYQPRVVALSIVEELQRLGLDVTPVGYTEARARREGLELSVIIHADEESFRSDDAKVNPTAIPGDTLIEFGVNKPDPG